MSRIALIPGEGIGPEITAEVVKVLGAVQSRSGLDLHLATLDHRTGAGKPAGQASLEKLIEELPNNFDAIFIGSLGEANGAETAWGAELRRVIIAKMDLFAHFRPVKFLDERRCPLKNKRAEEIQFAVISDNGAGILPEFGGSYRKGTPQEIFLRQMISTWQGADRIVRYAFDYVRLQGLKRLALSCHYSAPAGEDDLLKRVFDERRAEHPGVETSEMPIPTLMAQLLRTPEQFEVILTHGLYSDAIGNLGAELQGGINLGASADLHPGRASLFMAADGGRHNARQDHANPLGAMLAMALMLEHLGLDQEAQWVEGAVKNALGTDNTTYDLGGRLNTHQVGDFLAQQIKRAAC